MGLVFGYHTFDGFTSNLKVICSYKRCTTLSHDSFLNIYWQKQMVIYWMTGGSLLTGTIGGSLLPGTIGGYLLWERDGSLLRDRWLFNERKMVLYWDTWFLER